MTAIRFRRLLPAILLAFLLAQSGPACAQAAKGKAAEKAGAITALETKKLLQFLQKRFREKVVLKPDDDDPDGLEVEVDGELLGWIRRDDDSITGDKDFVFEWYILEIELDEDE